MSRIKFGTDGWRAIIGREFTTANVARVAEATALYIKDKRLAPLVVVGHDCRFAGELFAETVAGVMASMGIKGKLAKEFASTPVVSLAAAHFKAGMGVVITASHNPPAYNGYKLKGGHGGPLLEEEIREVEMFIPEKPGFDHADFDFPLFREKGMIEDADLDSLYCDYLEKAFDLEAIRNSAFEFAFDAMYGSGQNIMRKLFPDITLLHCERQPLFDGIPPEPLLRNLGEFTEMIRLAKNIDCGLAVDGDADRIALVDNQGNYIDSHHVILLLIHYLHHYKKMQGKVATGFSSTVKIADLCRIYGLPLEIVKIGFKHISGLMLEENILVGGEESGGIAVAGHIPERDGIYNGILLWEAMVKTGKSLRELIDEVYALTGPFAFERSDLRIPEEDKQRIVRACKNGEYTSFGPYRVQRTEDLDGFKYYFNDREWLMIRPSGTEPVLRTYAEAENREDALAILKAGYQTIMNHSA